MAYVGLMKPRIIELLLLTTVPVMFLAQGGVPPLGLVVATVIGGTLSAGSANALNCVYDADIDERMRRTRRRALPRHVVRRAAALVFGLVLGVVSTLWLGLLVNWLSAGLALAANVFYVVGYTMILKRRTTQNIVWGGAAGCFPALIGWTAVTGSARVDTGRAVPGGVLLDAAALLGAGDPLPRGLRRRRRADAPGRAGARAVARQIVAYSYVMVATSLLLWPVAGTGWFYPSRPWCSAARSWSSRTCCCDAPRLSDDVVDLKPMRLFHWSNMYLSLLFVAVALDPLLFAERWARRATSSSGADPAAPRRERLRACGCSSAASTPACTPRGRATTSPGRATGSGRRCTPRGSPPAVPARRAVRAPRAAARRHQRRRASHGTRRRADP